MATTKIRSSKQLFVDASLNVLNNKIINLADGTANTDAVSKGQMDAAIAAVSGGLSEALHTPVGTLAELKAITDYSDKMLINAEGIGQYRYDAESTAVSDDDIYVRPTNIADDLTAGRWIKYASPINNHNNLSGLQGGTTNQYYHFTLIEYQAATRTASSTQSGLLSSTDWSTFNGKQAALTFTPEDSSKKGVASGYASLNASSKVVEDPANATATPTASKIPIADASGKLDGWISGNIAGKNYVCREVPSGLINGSNPTFTLAHTPVSGTEMVFVNGILQNASASNDYTISGATITMATNPDSGDIILATYYY